MTIKRRAKNVLVLTMVFVMVLCTATGFTAYGAEQTMTTTITLTVDEANHAKKNGSIGEASSSSAVKNYGNNTTESYMQMELDKLKAFIESYPDAVIKEAKLHFDAKGYGTAGSSRRLQLYKVKTESDVLCSGNLISWKYRPQLGAEIGSYACVNKNSIRTFDWDVLGYLKERVVDSTKNTITFGFGLTQSDNNKQVNILNLKDESKTYLKVVVEYQEDQDVSVRLWEPNVRFENGTYNMLWFEGYEGAESYRLTMYKEDGEDVVIDSANALTSGSSLGIALESISFYMQDATQLEGIKLEALSSEEAVLAETEDPEIRLAFIQSTDSVVFAAKLFDVVDNGSTEKGLFLQRETGSFSPRDSIEVFRYYSKNCNVNGQNLAVTYPTVLYAGSNVGREGDKSLYVPLTDEEANFFSSGNAQEFVKSENGYVFMDQQHANVAMRVVTWNVTDGKEATCQMSPLGSNVIMIREPAWEPNVRFENGMLCFAPYKNVEKYLLSMNVGQKKYSLFITPQCDTFTEQTVGVALERISFDFNDADMKDLEGRESITTIQGVEIEALDGADQVLASIEDPEIQLILHQLGKENGVGFWAYLNINDLNYFIRRGDDQAFSAQESIEVRRDYAKNLDVAGDGKDTWDRYATILQAGTSNGRLSNPQWIKIDTHEEEREAFGKDIWTLNGNGFFDRSCMYILMRVVKWDISSDKVATCDMTPMGGAEVQVVNLTY